jgi:hypothetical protein
MIYEIRTKKEVIRPYHSNYNKYMQKKIMEVYVGVINPYGDYMIMDCTAEHNAIYHTERELPQVEKILQKEGIIYTINKINNGKLNKQTGSSRVNNNFNSDTSGGQLLECDICEGTGWLDINHTCPKCEP